MKKSVATSLPLPFKVLGVLCNALQSYGTEAGKVTGC